MWDTRPIEMKKTVYAYYESIPSIRQEEEFACSNLWKGSWENKGWACTMLNKTHAVASSLFPKLMTSMLKQTHITPRVMARFIRWCALHAVGGGWMTDYDVLNLGFFPADASEIESLHSLQLVAGARSYIFYATKEEAAKAIETFINSTVLENGVSIPEADLLKNEVGIDPVQKALFHPIKDDEMSRSQQMAQKISQ
jgi:hypothetical protein